METVTRLCKKDYTVRGEDGASFTIKRGKGYITSKVNTACAAHGPEPKAGNVVVFSTYWVSVPVDIFMTAEEMGLEK